MADLSSSTTQKPKLTRDILEREGIQFFEKVDAGELPGWLRPIAQHMLHCRSRFEPENEDLFSKELEEFNEEGHDNETAREENWVLHPPELHRGSVYIPVQRWQRVKQNQYASGELGISENIRDRAVELRKKQRDEPESKWADLLHAHVFRAFDDVHPRASEYHKLFTRWEIYRDVTWNEFIHRNASGSSSPPRTGPRPDLTYAFPMIDTKLMSTAERCLDVQVRGFSLDVLGELRNNEQVNLRSTPTTPLRRYLATKRNVLGATDMMCFPWAVVETKKSTPGVSGETKCYCQAANASAQALVMREELAKKAKERSKTLEACVIFAYTCIGPSIKLWMTYRDVDSGGILMRSIWASSLELTWGVLQLRMIVENMREWVYSRVKGDIARWVLKIHGTLSTPAIDSHWRRRHGSDAPTQRAPSTPPRSAPPRHPRTAPACVGRRSYGFPSTPSRSRRNEYVIDDFIDDDGVSDQDWDGDYDPPTSSEESSSDSDAENSGAESEDDSNSDDEEDDEVDDLIKDLSRYYPDVKRWPKMKACFRKHAARDDSSNDEDASDEQDAEEEEHTDDGGQTDDDEERYYIDGERVSNIFSRARQSLGMGSL